MRDNSGNWMVLVEKRDYTPEDFEGVDGEFYARLGGQYKFNQAWGVVADVKLIDGDEQYFVGPRFSF